MLLWRWSCQGIFPAVSPTWISPAKVLTRHIPPACSGDPFLEYLPANLTVNSSSSIYYPDVHSIVKLVTFDEKTSIRCFPASVFPEKGEEA